MSHCTLAQGLQCSLLGRLSGLPCYYLCICCGLLKKLLLLDRAGDIHGGRRLTRKRGHV